MDPVTAGIIAQVAASAVTKAAGWSTSKGSKLTRRRARKRAANEVGTVPSGMPVLDDAQVGRVGQFLRSGEFLLASSLYARAYLAADDSAYSGPLFEIANQTISDSLGYWLSEAATEGLALAIRAALLSEVSKAVDEIGKTSGFSAHIEAELAKTATAIVASNSVELLASLGLDARLEFTEFASQYRALAAIKHANMSLPHAGITRRVPYAALFVEPEIEFANIRRGMAIETEEVSGSSTVADAMKRSARGVILGNPGGGKSTLSQKLVYDTASAEGHVSPDVPFIVVLREYADYLDGRNAMSIASYIDFICRSPLEIVPPEGAIEYLLSTGRALVIFDGLDELLDTSLRRRVVDAVEGFANRFPLTSILVTSRKVGYEDAALDPDLFPLAILGNFSPSQVERYASNWFSLDESVEKSQQLTLTESFMEDSRFVNDLRVNPLMLALMCGIYASERYIPKNRPDVYEKCANLLLEQWDKQRGIEMALPFDALVQRAMRVLALHMYRNPEGTAGIARAKLVQFMTDYLLAKRFKHRDEAEDAANQFLDFCKGRAWVLSEVGADIYSFTHRTFLEYFAASQLVKEFTNAPDLYSELKEEISSGNATVVHHLALQILGKSTEDGAEDFFRLVLSAIDSAGSLGHAANECHFLVGSLGFLVVHPTLVEELMDRVVALFLEAEWNAEDTSSRTRLMRIMWELGGIASENSTTVQDSLERLLLLEKGSISQRTRALSIAANLEITSHDSAYGQHAFNQPWLDWAQKLRESALKTAEDMLETSSWAASEYVMEGQLTVTAMAELHGYAALYISDQAISFLVSSLPVALNLLGNFGRRSNLEVTTEDGLAIADFLEIEGNSELSVRPEPLASWGPSVVREKITSNANRWGLLLPILEALSQPGRFDEVYNVSRRGIQASNWLKELLATRSEALAIVDNDLELFLSQGSKESELVRRWIAGEINFLADTSEEGLLGTVRFSR